MKRAHHIKEDLWQYLLPMIKFGLLSKNWNFGMHISAVLSSTVSHLMTGVVAVTTVVFLRWFDEIHKVLGGLYDLVNQCFPNDQCMMF